MRIGTSGWNYPEWRGRFYPKGLAQRRWLEHISRKVNSVEINGSFYRLQKPEYYQSWAAQTPDDFVFAVKGSRFITHMKRLLDVEAALANFFASGVFRLGSKLGPILWQLPATIRFDPELLAAFFDKLPRTTEAGRPVRHALEPRHSSFTEPMFLDLLREHRIALVIADTAGKFPYLEDVTADFAYIRLHGDEELYASDYSDAALDAWAKKIRDLAGATEDVYVYFDNDINAHAPWNAISLAERLATRA
jgi:uncharacterized protein YecE (DUF72 family)